MTYCTTSSLVVLSFTLISIISDCNLNGSMLGTNNPCMIYKYRKKNIDEYWRFKEYVSL